jgi:hypothetical protein
LFGISTQKDAKISSLGRWVDNIWGWEVSCRRSFFEWEEQFSGDFCEVIALFAPVDRQGCWEWLGMTDEGFTVKATYWFLAACYNNAIQHTPLQEFVFHNYWRCAAPSKACAFSWQLLYR